MSTAQVDVGIKVNSDRMVQALRHLINVEIPHLQLVMEHVTRQSPEVIVAGIEGKAIVRAGMQDARRLIGEIA